MRKNIVVDAKVDNIVNSFAWTRMRQPTHDMCI